MARIEIAERAGEMELVGPRFGFHFVVIETMARSVYTRPDNGTERAGEGGKKMERIKKSFTYALADILATVTVAAPVFGRFIVPAFFIAYFN